MPLIYPWFSEHLLSIFNFFLTLTFVSFILRSKKPPGNTWAWLLFIIVAPYIGIPFYLIFSSRKFHTKFEKKEKTLFPGLTRKRADTIEEILEQLGAPAAKFNSETKIISEGENAYAAVAELISSAQFTIHLVTFIFSNDTVGRSILELLEKKVAQGVKVRILLDSFGSTWVRHPSFKKFKALGGEIGYFMPLLHLPLQGRYNLRNHRKILIVDSHKAILGGMNVANEYMGPKKDDTRWIDIGLRICGESAYDLDRIFVQDWKFATAKSLPMPAPKIDRNAHEHLVQIVASGPDVAGDPIYDSLLTLIFRAKKRMWVSSPYFIPDESLATAKNSQISASEFHDLNQCLDVAIAGAVTEYESQRTTKNSKREVEHLGFLAHELRNALNTVTVSHQLIKEGTVGFGGSTGKILERGLKRIDELIDRSLTEVRLRVDPIVQPESYFLLQLIDQIILTARVDAEARNQKFEIQIDPNLVITADQQLLHSAMSNLIQNALKYTRAGGTIRIRGDLIGTKAVIEVEDECGGLPDKSVDLFKAFGQHHENKTGLGLGLTIARRAITLNHGTIDVQDVPGKACIFKITLPNAILDLSQTAHSDENGVGTD